MTWIQKLGVRSFLVTDEVIATLNSSSSCTAHFESRSENQSNEDVSETRQTLTTTEQQRDDDKNSNTRPVSVPQQESCSSSHHEKEEDTEVKAGSPKVPLISLHSELGAPTAACAEAGAGDRVPDDARHVSSVVSDKVTEQRPSPMQPQRIVNELAHIPGYHSMVGNLKSQVIREVIILEVLSRFSMLYLRITRAGCKFRGLRMQYTGVNMISF
jgi:hypothetical protein